MLCIFTILCISIFAQLYAENPWRGMANYNGIWTVEGPEGVKWEQGFAYFLAGKMGFHALGLVRTKNATTRDLCSGMMGFSQNLGWEMGIGPPPPPFRALTVVGW